MLYLCYITFYTGLLFRLHYFPEYDVGAKSLEQREKFRPILKHFPSENQ